MMRSFHQHGISNAAFLSGLHKSQQVENSLEDMKREAHEVTKPSADRAAGAQLYNEIAKRHGIGMDS